MRRFDLRSTVHPLRHLLGGGSVVAFNAGPDGEVWIVLALEPLDYRTPGNGFATFAKTIPDRGQRYRVLSLRHGQVELDVVIDGEPFNIHLVQPVGDTVLLACARCEYRGADDVDRNGRLYSRDGRALGSLILGDGIESLQATRAGELWTGYFDEGVFGNYGWGVPLGAAGLVAWNRDGGKVYDYDPPPGVGSIADCYALNVATDDDVWCCYYTDFPLVHLRDKRVVSTWNVPVSGSHAFAVAQGHALFAGAYRDPDTFHLVRLEPEGKARLQRRFELRDAAGDVVTKARIVGRGGLLHALAGDVLYEIDIADMLDLRER